MKLRPLRLALAAASLIALTWPAMSQERVSFDGTSVSVVVPDGFVPMPDGKPGYMHTTKLAGVSAMQAPAVLFEQMKGKDLLQTQKEIIKQLGVAGEATSEQLVVGGRTYMVISAEMDMAGMPTSTWMVVSDPESSFILSFFQLKLPDGSEVALDREQVIKVLESVEVGAPLSFDDLAAELGIQLKVAAPFEFKTVFGQIIMLDTEQDPAKYPAAPSIMISRPPFAPGIPVDDIAVNQLNTAGKNSITEMVPVSFAGSEGKRLSGEVERNGVTETFVMYFASVGDAPLVFMATGTPEKMDAATIEVIDGIAKSVKRMEN